jgi:hypothetical protein
MPAYGSRRTCAGRPRARRVPVEGGADPRARRSLLEGERVLERGGPCSREAHPLKRDGAGPREACILEGIFERAALVGHWGPRGMGRILHG